MLDNFEIKIKDFLERFNIFPKNLEIYEKAFTHKSVNNTPGMNYERLEFLGDVVIKLIITDELLKNYPNYNEGQLAKARSVYIQDKLLSELAQQINLDAFLICAENESHNKINENQSVLADLFESLAGAIYLDQGLEKTKQFISLLFKQTIKNADVLEKLGDNKSKLQEITQSLGGNTPIYTTIKEEGPDHKKSFTIKANVIIKGKNYSTTTTGSTKKAAEQKAAALLIKKIT